MRLPWVSRAVHELAIAEIERLREEVERLDGERQRAVDVMLTNARLTPMHAEPKAKGPSNRRVPRRMGLVDVQRRLERQEAEPAE